MEEEVLIVVGTTLNYVAIAYGMALFGVLWWLFGSFFRGMFSRIFGGGSESDSEKAKRTRHNFTKLHK